MRNGDFIEIDVEARRVHLEVSDEEMAARLAAGPPAQGADRGADRGSEVGKDSH